MRTGTPDLLYPQRCLTLLGLGPLQKLTCQRQGHTQGNGEGRKRLHVWMVPLAAWVSNGFGPVAPFSHSPFGVTKSGIRRTGDDRDTSGQVEEAPGGREIVGHRGSGFGPVAVTRRCGTQSSTWTKPSNEAPSRTQTSYSERRWNFTWVKSSKSV